VNDQRSLYNQLLSMIQLANVAGHYDAADWIMNTGVKPVQDRDASAALDASAIRLYKILIADGNNRAIVRGYLSNAEVLTLVQRCEKAGVQCEIEIENLPRGLEQVLEFQDWNTAHDPLSIIEANE
jgi:hypothetical protein